MDGRKPTMHELLLKFASLKGLPVEKKPEGLVCRMTDRTILTLFYRPVVHGRFTFYGMSTDLSAKYARDRYYDKGLADYLREKMEESVETLERRAKSMDPEK